LRTVRLGGINGVQQQSCRWRQYFSVHQRRRPLCGVPLRGEEFSEQRHERRHRCVCAGYLRGSSFRLHPFDRARLRSHRRHSGQWRQHLGDDQRNGPLHHVSIHGDQLGPAFVVRRRSFPARYVRRRGRWLHPFHARTHCTTLEATSPTRCSQRGICSCCFGENVTSQAEACAAKTTVCTYDACFST
jgi:hypothetical protein